MHFGVLKKFSLTDRDAAATILPERHQQPRLFLQHIPSSIVPDDMISAADLFSERHLGVDHSLGLVFSETGPRDEPLKLHARRAGHDHDLIAQGFTAGFIKKRNISKK